MAFTYSLANDIGKVRFELGDTAPELGVRSDGSNITDEELQHLLDREGSVDGAVAAACEMLARDWAKVATESVGPRSQQLGNISTGWANAAKLAREKTSGGFGNYSSAVLPTKRVDGYSENSSADFA